MLTLFQDEWDALMLETHQVKTHLDTVRQELVKTLYQHDGEVSTVVGLQRCCGGCAESHTLTLGGSGPR